MSYGKKTALELSVTANEGSFQDSQIISLGSDSVYNNISPIKLLLPNAYTSNECIKNDDEILSPTRHLLVPNNHGTNPSYDSQPFILSETKDNTDTHQGGEDDVVHSDKVSYPSISHTRNVSISQLDMSRLEAKDTVSSPEPLRILDIRAQTDVGIVSSIENASNFSLQSHYPAVSPTLMPRFDEDTSTHDQLHAHLVEHDGSPFDIPTVHDEPGTAARMTISTQSNHINLPYELFEAEIRHMLSTGMPDHVDYCSNYSKTCAGPASPSIHEHASPDSYKVELDPNLQQGSSLPSSIVCSPCSSPAPNHYTTRRLCSPSSSLPSSSPPKIFSSSPPAPDEVASEVDVDAVNDSQGDAQVWNGPHALNPTSLPLLPIGQSIPSERTPVLPECEHAKGDGKVLAMVPHIIGYSIALTEQSLDENLNPKLSPPSLIVPEDAISPIAPTKRKRSLGDMGPPPLAHPIRYNERQEDEKLDGCLLKRIKCTLLPSPSRPVPANKRPTVAFQKIQLKKLKTPFRSPAMKVKPAISPGVNLAQNQASDSPASGSASCITADTVLTTTGTNTVNPTAPMATTVRTKRAGGQFKSPLSAVSSTVSSVRLTPTIQALERNVQILKRAVKVRKNGEEEELEGLVRKWTEAGREVAYELWGLVKDNESGDMSSKLQGKGKRGTEDWGWNVEKQESNWGWQHLDGNVGKGKEELCEDEERESNTLGTMLRQLGIAPETLGWDEDEGMFVGE